MNIVKVQENSNIKFFSLFLIICGFILILIIPPLAIPDENTHFINAYSISRGDIFVDYNDELDAVGKYFPSYILDFYREYKDKYAEGLEQKASYSEFYFLSWLQLDETSRSEEFYSVDMLRINPVAYIFAASGIKIGVLFTKIFGGNFDTAYNLLLFSRISNYIAYCIIGICAVKRSPRMKKVLAILLVNPTTLYCCVSANYDAIIIPITMLFVAEILHLIVEEDVVVNKYDMFIVFFCTIFMAAIKMAYAPFLALLLLVPVSKFKSKKQYWWSIGGVAASGLIAGILPSLIMSLRLHGHSAFAHEAVEIQKQYLFSHLYLIPKIIIDTFKEYNSFYLTSFVGKMGLLDINYPLPFMVLLLFGLIFVTLVEVSKIEKISVRFKVLDLLLIILIVIGMFMVMYLNWSSLIEGPKGATVTGIQGRYFFPIYCFLALLFASNIHSKVPEKIAAVIDNTNDFVFKMMLVVQPLTAIVLVMQRYWF